MKQSTIIFLVIFSILITLLTPRASSTTGATLTLTNFEKGENSVGPSKCNGVYHSNDLLLVSLSTGWNNNGNSCYKGVSINYNGVSVTAVVVDGCDPHDEGYCTDDIVAASKSVWRALQVPQSEWGNEIQVTWSFLD